MCRFFLLTLSCIITLSCAKSVTVSQKNNNTEKINEYNEDLSVFRPKYAFEEQVNKPKIETQAVEQKTVESTTKIKSDTQAVDEILKQMKDFNAKISDGRGYRIQLFSGNDKMEFENAKTYLYRNFSNLEVYESYSQPTYKIKVGDFVSREDAEKYLSELKSRFSTIRIISEKINIKKALENK
jgi:hypothetical protein